MSIRLKSIKNRTRKITDLEFIANQNSSKLQNLTAIISSYIKDIKENNMQYNSLYYTNIGLELYNIFKFRISLINEKNTTPRILIVPTKVNSNALVRNISSISSVFDLVSEQEQVSNRDSILLKAKEVLDNSLSTKGITVDLYNATITGLDSEYRNIILIDIPYLVNKYDHSSEEIVSQIIHEVGHVFDYIRSLEFSSDSTSMLLDDIRNDYINKGKEPKEILLSFYKKIGGDVNSIKGKNILSIAIEVSNSILCSNSRMNVKEEEYSADTFAVRFGLGEYLLSALRKMDTAYDGYNIVKVNALAVSASVLTLLYLVLLPVALLPILGYVLVLLPVNGFLWYNAGRVSTVSNRYSSNGYDAIIDRISRIKQQMVSSLKHIDDKEISKTMIDQIDAISVLLNRYKGRMGIISSILKKFSFRKNKLDTHYLAESLLNSDINISKKRLELI